MLTILTNPNPILRDVSKPVEPAEILRPAFQKFLDEMIETMVKDGVGLAAPQVGVGKRFIIVQTKSGPQAFINPKIFSTSIRKVSSEEGCLSVPGVWGIVKRHSKVKVKALNRLGEKVIIKASGLESIIFQHEIDHLDGILFIDKVEKITRGASL
ncbi:MAG: peptide deformylase [Patescibacteria group bacterium]|jgi:peptide deformylase